MPKESDSISHGGEAGGPGFSFSDLTFQNERAMWWAEFESVGEEAVRGYVERNSYTPTGMEAARQWLARREFLQLREEVQSIKALAEQAQRTASESLRRASEALANRVEANTIAVVETAASAKKTARIMVFVGVVAFLIALCAIVMVLASSRQGTPNTQQAFAQPSRPKQAIVRAPAPAAPPVETHQASAIPPEDTPKEQPSIAPQINSPDLKPEGQSLAETLALIADKVGGEGAINFTAQFRDMATGQDHTQQLSYKASNVTIDPNRCQMGYYWHVEQDGRAVSDQDRTVELRLAKSIRVASIDAEPGRRFSMRAYPKVYVVHIAGPSSGDELYFRDKNIAARVGAAIRRAVALCDKGSSNSRVTSQRAIPQ